MNTFHHNSNDFFALCSATLDGHADAGIDPAFDTEVEDLVRQFATWRLTFGE